MSRFSRFALLALLAITLAVPAHSVKKICVYNGDSTIVTDLQSLLGSGFNVVNFTAAQWSALGSADFQACNGIFVPDTDNLVPSFSQSGYTALEGNKTTWGAAVTGNVVLSGVHMGGHGLGGGVGRVVSGLLSFITSGSGTGFLSGTDRTNDLYAFASVFGVGGNNSSPCDDNIVLASPLPTFLANLPLSPSQGGFGVLQSDLANQGCSAHNWFPTRPPGVFSTVAIDLDQHPAQDVVIARQAGGASQLGGGTTIFINTSGGQVITSTSTTSFTFTIGRINSSGSGFRFAPNIPGARGLAFLFCSSGRGRFLVVVNRQTGTGTVTCL